MQKSRPKLPYSGISGTFSKKETSEAIFGRTSVGTNFSQSWKIPDLIFDISQTELVISIKVLIDFSKNWKAITQKYHPAIPFCLMCLL